MKEITSTITNLIEEDDGDNSEPLNGRSMQKSSITEFSKLIDFLMDLVLVTETSDLKTITFSASKKVERNNIIRKLKKKATPFFK